MSSEKTKGQRVRIGIAVLLLWLQASMHSNSSAYGINKNKLLLQYKSLPVDIEHYGKCFPRKNNPQHGDVMSPDANNS